ncbi:DUF1850 domain-containing protein [Halanaerobium praevalens]|uniref:DUF1850 domain-containing protein n=1 Tax=Halanaerobium praevalens (strain ATCC 33744 / DSM 2228 / GSL) TaxID=572479 RepID=E3DNV7_HALPG|nr:DUF1850 domain-containing protein [Halanaerobium praevalens]ADO76581.1 Domain of unknown function DUF1850 [Halanaerobium praevalens DSM 2228]
MKNTRLLFIMLKKIKFKSFYLIFLSLILIFSLNFIKISFLEIIDYQADKTILAEKVDNGDQFSLKYLHSVARTPVIEFFKIKDQKILLTGTEYQSYGAGLPTSNNLGDYILKDNKFIIQNIDQVLPEIMLRVSNYAQTEFIYNQKTYKLFKLAKNETLFQIKIKKISYLSFILRRYYNG